MRGLLKKFITVIFRSLFIYFWIVSFPVVSPVVQAETDEIRKIWYAGPQMHWIAEKSLSPESLSITVNGKTPSSRQLTIKNYNGSVHVRILLTHRMSSVITIKKGNTVLFHADVYSAPRYDMRIVPEGYEPALFHIEKNEKPCLACHRLSVQESDKKPGISAENICFPCHHADFDGFKFEHAASGVTWACLICHEAEAMETDHGTDGPVKFIIKEDLKVAPLCYKCHSEREKEFSAYEYVHAPVAMDRCIECHNPHGSHDKNFLQRQISVICIECHEMQEIMATPNVHEPLVKKGCTACHDPHGSNFPYALETVVQDLCLNCHPKIRRQKNNHPTTGHPVSGLKDPSNVDRPFSCTSCHNPHSSEFDLLLAEENIMMLCIHCHTEYR